MSDIIIIGGGPAGYEVAAEAAREGKSVTLIERGELGGTCLNRGCIPTKCLCACAGEILSLRHAADYGIDVAGFTASWPRAIERMRGIVERLRQGIDQLLKPVEVIHGEARLEVDAATGTAAVIVGDDIYTAPTILIATGSAPAALRIPGADLAITSDELLAMDELPKRVAIIGGGVIGMEFASILAAYDVEVTVIEYCKEILPPFDAEVAKRLRSMLGRRGVNTIVGAAVTEISRVDDGALTVVYEGKKGAVEVAADAVVMAVGRRPVLPEGLPDEAIGPRGFIKVDERFRTVLPGVYAVGDVNGVCMLAHAGAYQARVALGFAEPGAVIPSAVFTIPECAMVGPTPAQLDASGMPYASAKAMFAGNGKALAMGEGDGFFKVLYDSESCRIIAAHVIGPHAADLIAEATALIEAGVTVDAAARRIVHGHPTLSEIIAAACAAAR